ncbi:MAG: hypothetical protein R2849_21850 [Thermomicrobiales bacterium]
MRIEICLTLLSTEGGGRKRPLGVRQAMCWIGNMAGEFKTFNDARLQVIAPGETARLSRTVRAGILVDD